MLSSMRNFAKGFLAKCLVLLLIVSFAIWGIGDVFQSHSKAWVASVGDHPVLAIEFESQRNQMRQAMSSLGVKNIDENDINNEVLRRLIQHHLVDLWLFDAGLAVNRELQAQTIRQNRQFKDITGKFDKQLFNQILTQQRITEGAYLVQLRKELANRTLLSSLAMPDAVMPVSMMNLAHSAQAQTRDAIVFTLRATPVDPSSIDAQSLQDFYAVHKNELYLEPERRTLEYITLDKNDVAALVDASITDSMLKDRYAANTGIAPTFEAARGELLKQLRSEQHDMVLQTFSSTLEDALAGGETVGEAMAKAGVKAQSKLLTSITAAQLSASNDGLLRAVASQGFALANGDTSGLQATENGRFFVVSVKEVIPAAPKELALVKGDVAAQVARQKQGSAMREQAQKVKAALQIADATARNAALADFQLQRREVRQLRRPTVDALGKLTASDASLPAVLQQSVFEHRIGGIAGPATLSDGSMVFAQVEAVHQPTRPIDGKTLAALQTTYQTGLGDAVTGAMFNTLAEKYSVSINQPLLQQLTQPQ